MSVLLFDTVARDREATERRKEALETVTLAQDNMVWESFFEGGVKPLSSGRLALTVSTESIRSASVGYDGTCLARRFGSEPSEPIPRGQSVHLHSPEPDRLGFLHPDRDICSTWSPADTTNLRGFSDLAPAGTMSAKHDEPMRSPFGPEIRRSSER